MFRLMRNIHLWLGLAVAAMALMFAVSSIWVVYRPFLPDEVQESERVVRVAADAAETPRALARTLMLEHDMKGDLLGVEEDADAIRFRLSRPGTEHRVSYDRVSGEATIQDRHWGLGHTLLQIHTTHGFWHDFAPNWVWALLSLLTSIGLLLLGGSGIYLWFAHHAERVTGGILLALGLSWGIITLVLTRMDS